MPANRRMIVANNGRVDTLITGTFAAKVRGGRRSAAPDTIHQRPSRMMRIAGIMLPRITHTLQNFVEATFPKYAIAVVPQTAIIITLNMFRGLFTRAGVSTNASVDAINERTVGKETRLLDNSQSMAVNPPFSPNACFTHT